MTNSLSRFLFPWHGPLVFPSHPQPNSLRTGLLLLLLPESEQTDTRDLDDLETNTGNITLGLTLTTETGKEDLVVLVDEVKATVVGDCEILQSAYHQKSTEMRHGSALLQPFHHP